MKIRFTIHFKTEWGQRMFVSGSEPELGAWNTSKAKELGYLPGDVWSGEISLGGDGNVSLEYKYILIDANGKVIWESGPNRIFTTDEEHSPWLKTLSEVDLIDSWRAPADIDGLFLTSAFRDVILKDREEAASEPQRGAKVKKMGNTTVRFRVFAPRARKGDRICVLGSAPSLGEWNMKKAVPMKRDVFPYWSLETSSGDLDETFDYKYVILDKKGEPVMYEDGPDRKAPGLAKGTLGQEPQFLSAKRLISTPNDKFRYPSAWRGAGLAIPVFSLRSGKSLGIGEFSDLKPLADWASECGLKLIQILPVNDTSASMTWMDSYPYSNISVFALHPIYISVEEVSPLGEAALREIDEKRKTLNSYDYVHYEDVLTFKRKLLKDIFAREKEKFLASEEFRSFLDENAFWLEPYAAFSALRDATGSVDFAKWGKYSAVKPADIAKIVSPGSEYYETAAFYYFLQFHLHRQLSGASRYMNSLGIILKGDIPIGINKHSDSCWMSPHLFNMDQSAGAPPDPFSDDGQNWGFPTYNWGAMANDGYRWWRERLRLMGEYFQAVRLDHILGFFRIWEIPDTMTSGLMGHFNPAIPVSWNELEQAGFGDAARLADPFIPKWLVKMIFGSYADEVMVSYLDAAGDRFFKLKPGLDTQRSIQDRFKAPSNADAATKAKMDRIRTGLSSLAANILFFRDAAGRGYHPRINMADTCSFACLDEAAGKKLKDIYHDYFWRRQDSFWRDQAMTRLPVIKSSSDMLICGEDLGMVPACVKPVMEELSILGLRVQSMPHVTGREFGLPSEYEYLTVCTTSTHDMPTLRGWWAEDHARAQRYYNTMLNHPGDSPKECTPGIATEIILHHLLSPSMWAVFPLQDILAMSKDLRREGDPNEERINRPSDPDNYWKFRLHIDLEKLMDRKDFTAAIFKMVSAAGRYEAY